MEINLKIRYIKKHPTKDEEILCFRHAVEEAIKGFEIIPEVDDYSSDYDFRPTGCNKCTTEWDESKRRT